MRRTLLTFALSVAACLPANAQQLKLSFNDGRVSIDATSVPVRTILVEWGKLGGTKVIGGERVAGAPLTLRLENVPESQALEIVLRSVAGYMAAPRSAAATGASMYDRILVMATSAAPAARPAGNVANPGANPAPQRFAPPRPARADEEEPEEEEDPNPPNPPVFSFPQPGQTGLAQPGTFPNAPPGSQPPMIMLNPNSGEPQGITINPASNPGVPPAFGSPTPGMIAVPQPQQQPPRPGATVRPPGGGPN